MKVVMFLLLPGFIYASKHKLRLKATEAEGGNQHHSILNLKGYRFKLMDLLMVKKLLINVLLISHRLLLTATFGLPGCGKCVTCSILKSFLMHAGMPLVWTVWPLVKLQSIQTKLPFVNNLIFTAAASYSKVWSNHRLRLLVSLTLVLSCVVGLYPVYTCLQV